MTEREALTLALEALENNRQTHHYCEDTWYSCPKHEDGCANDSEGDECNCGADKANAEIDKAITAIKEALAQPEQKRPQNCGTGYCSCVECVMEPEQEPVAWAMYQRNLLLSFWMDKGDAYDFEFTSEHRWEPLYTSPPAQRTWVGLTDDEITELHHEIKVRLMGTYKTEDIYRAIEAKLKGKNAP